MGGQSTVIATRLQQTVAGLLIAGVVLCCAPAQGAPLWYNGDADNRDALVNQTSSSFGGIDQVVYDNFVVPAGQTWTVTGVFSNDVVSPFFGGDGTTTASWAILSGVSAGNGGTVVASGDGTDNITYTGIDSTVYSPFNGFVYTNEVDVSVTLGPGTYWLAVAPDTDGLADSYWAVATTSGANAVGTPPGNDGNSYVTSTFFGENFAPTTTLEGPGTWDYSMGVIGTSSPLVTAAPEPSVVALLTGAGLSLALYGFAAYRRNLAIVATPA
jgi:hypothetical protein